MNKIVLIVVIAIALIGGYFLIYSPKDDEGTVKETDGTSSFVPVGKNAIFVADQKPDVDINASIVNFENGGYVVVHEDNGGAFGAILGASKFVPAGFNKNILATLSRETAEGEVLYAMLHKDNGDQIFNDKDDVPVMDDEGRIIYMIFNIDSEAVEPVDVLF